MSSPLPPTLSQPPPSVRHTLVSFPAPHVLLVTLNRPGQLNCIPRPQQFELERLWDWYDDEPSLRAAVITGTGRAFCAGADLKEWDSINRPQVDGSAAAPAELERKPHDEGSHSVPGARPSARFPPGGFGGMSNRPGLKPIIAAVNGICFGGGMEMAINCDLVIAAERAVFGLPEVTIGVVALAGALPRLVRSVGRQRAAEMALAGGRYDAETMKSWGLVNEVVKGGDDGQAVLARAVDWAKKIAGNSPDAVIVSREGLKIGWEGIGPDVGTEVINRGWYGRIDKGENMTEGVQSFVERRKPVWKNSKL